MKKIIIGITLLFSISTACTVPHEEILGVKIGCPIVLDEHYEEIARPHLVPYGYKVYDDKSDTQTFFDRVDVYVDQEIIVGLSLYKAYHVNKDNIENIQVAFVDDAQRYAFSLINTWGGFKVNESENLLGLSARAQTARNDLFYFKKLLKESMYSDSPNSDVLGYINITMHGDKHKELFENAQEASIIGFTIEYLTKTAYASKQGTDQYHQDQ